MHRVPGHPLDRNLTPQLLNRPLNPLANRAGGQPGFRRRLAGGPAGKPPGDDERIFRCQPGASGQSEDLGPLDRLFRIGGFIGLPRPPEPAVRWDVWPIAVSGARTTPLVAKHPGGPPDDPRERNRLPVSAELIPPRKDRFRRGVLDGPSRDRGTARKEKAYQFPAILRNELPAAARPLPILPLPPHRLFPQVGTTRCVLALLQRREPAPEGPFRPTNDPERPISPRLLATLQLASCTHL